MYLKYWRLDQLDKFLSYNKLFVIFYILIVTFLTLYFFIVGINSYNLVKLSKIESINLLESVNEDLYANKSNKNLYDITKFKFAGSDLTYEYILVDGGSTDASLKIAKKFKNIKLYSLKNKQRGESIKYGIKKRPKMGRLIDNKMYKKRYSGSQVFKIAEKFSQLAKEQHLSPISLAIAWVASHPAVTAPIIGGRNSNQLKESLKSVDIKMTKKLRNEISVLSPKPPNATDRNEEHTIYNYDQI